MSPPSDFWSRVDPSSFRVPAQARRFFYTLGGIVFIGFLILILTGLLLAQVYHPAPEQTYNSLRTIQTLGWTRFVRAVHYWTAQGILIALLLHLSRVFVTGAYKYPRQATWWCGVALFATMLMGSYFSGTVLRWDEAGGDALAHYQEALHELGPIGTALTEALSGSAPMNFRIYISHTALFPLLLTGLILLHFYLIHTLNLSPTPKDAWADQPDVPASSMTGTLGEHARSIFIFSALYYGWIVLLAFFVEAPLGSPLGLEPAPLKPPWPFLWMYEFENRWGIGSVVYASAVFFGILAAVPLLDRKPDRRFCARKPILALGACFAVTWVGLTLYGYLSPAQSHTHHHTHQAQHEAHEETPPSVPLPHETEHSHPSDTSPADVHDTKSHSHAEDDDSH